MATITRNFIARTLRQCNWLFVTLLSGDVNTSFFFPVSGTDARNVRANFAGIVNHLAKSDKTFSPEERQVLQQSWKSRSCTCDTERNTLYFKALNESRIVSINYDHSKGLIESTLREIPSVPSGPLIPNAPKLSFDFIPFHPDVFLAFCTIKQHGAYSKEINMTLPDHPLPDHSAFGNVAVVIDEASKSLQIL